GTEMQHPAAVVVIDPRFEYAAEDLAIGTDGGRGGAVVGQILVRSRPWIKETPPMHERECRAVQTKQITDAALHRDVDSRTGKPYRRRAVVGQARDAGIIGGHRGRNPRSLSVMRDAGDAALQIQRGGAEDDKPEVEIPQAVGGDG